MEEAGNGASEMTKAAPAVGAEFSTLRVLSHTLVAVFFFLAMIFSLGELNYYCVAIALVAVAFYASSLRSRSLGLVSLGWMLLGVAFVLSFISSGRASDLTVTLSVVSLIISYELTRFGFVVDSVAEKYRALHEESITRLRRIMRNHSMTLAAVSALVLASSIVLEYFSLGVIVITPPAVGVTVFVVLAVFLVAFTTLRRK